VQAEQLAALAHQHVLRSQRAAEQQVQATQHLAQQEVQRTQQAAQQHVAQVTTAGKLDYKLNIMIGTPEGQSIQYVHANPQDREILHPALTGQFVWQGNTGTGKKSKGKKSKKKS
jgi:hypothetical protein